jgi:hypothetical protein
MFFVFFVIFFIIFLSMRSGRAAAASAAAVPFAANAAAGLQKRRRARQYAPPPKAIRRGMNSLSLPRPATLPIRKRTQAHTAQKSASKSGSSLSSPKRRLIWASRS